MAGAQRTYSLLAVAVKATSCTLFPAEKHHGRWARTAAHGLPSNFSMAWGWQFACPHWVGSIYENQITCTILTGRKQHVRRNPFLFRCRRRRRILRASSGCCLRAPSGAACNLRAACLRATWICLGRRLLVSARVPLCMACWLLGSSTIRKGLLGRTEILRASLLPGILALSWNKLLWGSGSLSTCALRLDIRVRRFFGFFELFRPAAEALENGECCV